MVEFDFGKVENIIGFNKYIEEKLSEKQKIIDEQQSTIQSLKEENGKLNQLLNEAEDLIESRLAEHFAKQYENIKHNIIGD